MTIIRMQMRRGTAAAWTAANPVLADGEHGYENDTKKLKIGDGITAWAALGYRLSDPTGVAIPGGGTVGGPAPVVASRDLAATDSLNALRCNSAATITLNIPAGLPLGFGCAAVQMGAGKVTITAGGGVTLISPGNLFSTNGQYAAIGIIQTAANEYVLSGLLG